MMQSARDRHSACVYDRFKRYIIVSGAYKGLQARSVERYDTFLDNWKRLPSMKMPRAFHASCSVKVAGEQEESLYVFCGFQKTQNVTMSSIEKLKDPLRPKSRWQVIELPLMQKCWYLGVVPLDSREIVILGGRDECD